MRLSILIFFSSFLYYSQSFAQQVGIGTTTPTEKLDVNGNLNLSGNIKMNGNAGKSGQVLMMNSNGQQQWAHLFGYKNSKEFTTADTWIVPTGITEILVEVVGAGGGGAKGGGGGGGSYVVAIYKVAAGQAVQITVGSGGGGSLSENVVAGNGLPSSVSILSTNNTAVALGGTGAGPSNTGYGNPYLISGDSILYAKGYFGNNGSPTVETYSQRTATEFITVRQYGDGGTCMYNPARIKKGTFLSFNTASQATIVVNYASSNPDSDGSGGGGGNTSFFTWGYPGSDGRVTISW